MFVCHWFLKLQGSPKDDVRLRHSSSFLNGGLPKSKSTFLDEAQLSHVSATICRHYCETSFVENMALLIREPNALSKLLVSPIAEVPMFQYRPRSFLTKRCMERRKQRLKLALGRPAALVPGFPVPSRSAVRTALHLGPRS